ncbi:hypothetical protein C4F17_02465 [Variovorax sp. PMC12]|nr:hypothetical protein C4F17_02465 [Variovorax sp. PMC12]
MRAQRGQAMLMGQWQVGCPRWCSPARSAPPRPARRRRWRHPAAAARVCGRFPSTAGRRGWCSRAPRGPGLPARRTVPPC